MSFDVELKPQLLFDVNFGEIAKPERLGYLKVGDDWKLLRDTFICIDEQWKQVKSKFVLVDGVWKEVLVAVPISQNTDIIFVESVDFASTSTTEFGPTVPNYVNDNYIGVLMEFTATRNAGSTVPSGWTQLLTQPSPFTSGAGISISYKILSESDRGTTPGAIYGGNQRDQLFVFKNENGSISSITAGNLQASSATGSLSANAPSITNNSAIAIHYFYNSSTATPTVTSNPSMTLVRSTVNNFHGGQYIIYNPSETPLNQTTNATLAGTIGQALFWLIVE